MRTVIFLGPQGSGKGTQAKVLAGRLANDAPVMHYDSGARFRALSEESGEVSARIGEMLSRGERMPLFLSVRQWTNSFIEAGSQGVHWVLDGIPRRMDEAHLLSDALSFFERSTVDVVVLSASDEVAIERLMARGRADDTREAIANRLSWYHEELEKPLKEFYESQENATVHIINGEQTPEDVSRDIAEALGNL